MLFLLGIWGIFFNRKNIVVMLMCIELMLLAVNLNFLIFSTYLDDSYWTTFFSINLNSRSRRIGNWACTPRDLLSSSWNDCD